jgi:hypothetical protein
VSPETAEAAERLGREGVLSPAQSQLFSRVARGELVSVYRELRFLLYGGVLLTMAGVGFLVKENFEALGPLAIASSLALMSAGCLAWVHRRSAPFSWGEAAAPHLAFEYLLLLGVLLAGADLAYVEAKFTPLGDAWPWHLLVMSLLSAALAVRYDSRIVFALALSTFAAWRGTSVVLLEKAFWSGSPATSLRANAIACGLSFLLLGAGLVRFRRKPHFEPVAAHAGWLLALGAFASGIGGVGVADELCLLVAGAFLAAFAFRRARFSLFVLGVLGAYVALSALFLRARPGVTGGALWFTLTSLAVLAGLLAVHGRMKAPE